MQPVFPQKTSMHKYRNHIKLEQGSLQRGNVNITLPELKERQKKGKDFDSISCLYFLSLPGEIISTLADRIKAIEDITVPVPILHSSGRKL